MARLNNFFRMGILVWSWVLIAPHLCSQGLVATTESGKVKGTVENGVLSFKGIPYAAPPIGQLRWRPPQAVIPWEGIRAATDFGADCMQLPFPSDAAPLGGSVGEDCLYVNVWKPATRSGRRLPVMVWIYGGGFVNGGSSPPVYDGRHFAEHGLVFVSFNHRLGRFGFFAHPALTRESPGELQGNYGYMDQIAALKWVRRNIAAFGGDPRQVAVLGESAGGGCGNGRWLSNEKEDAPPVRHCVAWQGREAFHDRATGSRILDRQVIFIHCPASAAFGNRFPRSVYTHLRLCGVPGKIPRQAH